jgi:predicted RND superfamily exporter protein
VRRRFGWRGLAAALVLVTIAAITAGGLARLRVETGISSFLPSGDPAGRELDRLARSFGGDPVLVLLESRTPRALLGPERLPRLLRLEGRLSGLPDVAVVYGPATTLNQIAIQTQGLLAEISGRRDGLRAAAEASALRGGATAAQASAAGERAVRKFEIRYGSLLVRSLPVGLPTLRNPRFAESVVFGGQDGPRPQWRYVVPAPDAVAILVRPRQGLDQAGTERLVRAVGTAVAEADLGTRRVTVTGAPAVAAALGGQVRKEVPLIGAVALTAVAVCLLAVGWTRRRRRLVPLVAMLAATGLTLALFGWRGQPLSLGVVAFLPVLLGVGTYYPIYLAQRAHRRLVLVMAGAAAAGFGALALSPLPFVRDLGVALATGVVLAVAAGLVLAPRLGVEAPPRADEGPSPGRVPRGVAVGAVAALVALAAVGWAQLPRLPLEAHPERLAAGLSALADARHAEAVLGASGEVDIVLRGGDVLTPEALRWMRHAEDAVVVRYGDRMRPVLSAPDLLRFLGDAPTGRQITAAMRLLPSYLTGAVVRDDGREALVSFGVRLGDLAAQRDLLDGVRTALPPPPPGYTVEVTGLPVAAARGYDLVSTGRYAGNLAGVAAAGLVLLVGLRRRGDAVRAVAAALVATGVGLGALWLLSIPLTPVTVALGSLTAAVGCEFTVLLAEARRRGDAVLARSVLLAAITAAVGYGALALSDLAMIRQFGLLLAGSVGLSLLTAACVTAALPDARTEEPSTTEPLLEVKECV